MGVKWETITSVKKFSGSLNPLFRLKEGFPPHRLYAAHFTTSISAFNPLRKIVIMIVNIDGKTAVYDVLRITSYAAFLPPPPWK